MFQNRFARTNVLAALACSTALGLAACGTVSSLNPILPVSTSPVTGAITNTNIAQAEAAISATVQQTCQALPQAEDVLALIKANWASGAIVNSVEAIAGAICTQVQVQVAAKNSHLKSVHFKSGEVRAVYALNPVTVAGQVVRFQ